MYPKIVTIILIILSFSETVNPNKVEITSELIFDYLSFNKQIRSVELFVCWQRHQLVNFAKRLMDEKITVDVIEVNNNLLLEKIFRNGASAYHQGVVLDLNCQKSFDILKARF